MRVLRPLWDWIESRFELDGTVGEVVRHPVPRELARRVGWFYVFGSVTLTLFVVQVVTGVGLAMTYVPAPNSAYDSLVFITNGAAFGSFVRGLHFWGASAMVVFALIHMTQVFLFGAQKFPREANWMSGSLLLVMTLAMAFTGQLLRWDQDAFWAVVVAAQQAARAPVVGDLLATIVIAGQNVGGATLTRFYATHVFLIPAVIYLLIALHVYLVLRRGISDPPKPDHVVDPASERGRYASALARGIPFYPLPLFRDAAASTAAVLLVAVLALVVGPPRLGAPPDPTVVVADPRPDWMFIAYFALLALIPRGLEVPVIVGLPLAAFAFLFLLPLVRPYGYRHWSRRPLAIGAVAGGVIAYAALTFAGYAAPWAPYIPGPDAALPSDVTAGLSATQARGAKLFQTSGCWSCHRVEGSGGRRGPDLTHVASRLERDRIVARILTGGGGAMPAYAGTLSPEDVGALTEFLLTRR